MINLLKRLLNSVLLLTLIALASATSLTLYESFLYDYKGASVVMITKTTAGRSGGTGSVVVAPSGKKYTLTNAHICRMGKNLIAHKQNGETQEIKVIEIYRDHDLCIMEPVDGLRPLKIAKNIILHERVWLIGHPALRPLTLESGHFVGMMDISLSTTCSKLEIEEQRKQILKELEKLKNEVDMDPILKMLKMILLLDRLYQFKYNRCIKTVETQHINNIAYGGNSGSPVVDKFGNIIGLLFAGSRSQPTASFVVPLYEIHKFLEDK